MPEMASAKIEQISFRINSARRGGRAAMQGLVDRLRDGSCHFVLQAQDISQLTVVAFGPEILIRFALTNRAEMYLVAAAHD
jgi:hypothetical protein